MKGSPASRLIARFLEPLRHGKNNPKVMLLTCSGGGGCESQVYYQASEVILTPEYQPEKRTHKPEEIPIQC